jgi:hypothetical protein
MLKGVHNESGKFKSRKEEAKSSFGREDGRAGAGGRTCRRKPGVPPGEHCTSAAVALEAEVPSGRNCEPKDIKRGPKPKEDPALAEMRIETERLSQALLETSIELQAMKKKSRSV